MELPVDEVIDPHIHLWDVRGTPRILQNFARAVGWNDRLMRAAVKKGFPEPVRAWFGERTSLVNDYLPTDYRNDSASSNVGRYVHIQAGWKGSDPLAPVGETQWLASLEDGPAGIVGYADFMLGTNVGEVLQAHKDASPAFRGIRYMLSRHPSDQVHHFADAFDLPSNPQWMAGYEQLVAHELSFDAWCYHQQLADVVALARSVPDVPIVLNHCGSPVGIAGPHQGVGISEQERARIRAEWEDGISALATESNTSCKLSGLLMPGMGFGYEHTAASPSVGELVERMGPMLTHCIDAFGPDRCMFASNFPVDLVSVDYETLVSAVLEITDRFGAEAQQSIFHDTAERFYRL